MGKITKLLFGLGTIFLMVAVTLSLAVIDDDYYTEMKGTQHQMAVLETRKKQLLEQKSTLEIAYDSLLEELTEARDVKQQEEAARAIEMLQAQEAQRQQMLEQQRQQQIQQQMDAARAAPKRRTRAS